MRLTWTEKGGYWEAESGRCIVTIEPRPIYCDRGRFIAKVFPNGAVHVDHQDGWPRYYFDFERAKAEIEAWFEVRGLLKPEKVACDHPIPSAETFLAVADYLRKGKSVVDTAIAFGIHPHVVIQIWDESR